MWNLILLCLFVLFTLFILRKLLIKQLLQRMEGLHQCLRQMFQTVVPLLKKSGLTWWITDGTLLGYIRENGTIIPHDDDIDLIIFEDEKYEEGIQKLREELRQHNFILNDKEFGFAIDNNDHSRVNKTCFIDLFVYRAEGEDHQTQGTGKIWGNEYVQHQWPRSYYYSSETFPLKEGIFEDVSVNIPNQPEIYLSRMFGDWKKRKVTHVHHANWFERKFIFLTSWMDTLL